VGGEEGDSVREGKWEEGRWYQAECYCEHGGECVYMSEMEG